MANKKLIYLDWASAAPVSKFAKKVFLEAIEAEEKIGGNPGSPHFAGVRAKRILEDARLKIARLASVKPDGVIFTSGATEANALALNARKGHVLYLPTSHASIIENVQALKENGVFVEPLVIMDGRIDLVALEKQIRPETSLVALDLICGETGTRYDARAVRRVLDAARKNAPANSAGSERILLHVDASQAPLTDSIELNRLGADLLTLDAQKVGGVRGIGALTRAHALVPIEPIMGGGGQEFGIRPGTENPALAAAFAEALIEAAEDREEFTARAAGARNELIRTITTAFPDTQINVGKEFTPHLINFSFPNRDTDYGVMFLSEIGYAVSTKSACETNEEGSRAVFALTHDSDRARSTLRVSWGPTTTDKELRDFAKSLIKSIHFLDTHEYAL